MSVYPRAEDKNDSTIEVIMYMLNLHKEKHNVKWIDDSVILYKLIWIFW
jgi:hypothetical protein